MSKVFISYRRDDSSGYAQTIYRELVQHFSKDRVFMDVDTVEPGVDFVRVIEEAVGKSDVLLVLIGKRWASVRRGAKSRLDDPTDFVRLEISAALARDIRVIPVLVDGMKMPAEMTLPPSLKALTRRNAMEISHTRFNYDMEQLIAAVRRVLEFEAQRRIRAEVEEERRIEEEKGRAQREAEQRRLEAEAQRKAEEERLREERALARSPSGSAKAPTRPGTLFSKIQRSEEEAKRKAEEENRRGIEEKTNRTEQQAERRYTEAEAQRRAEEERLREEERKRAEEAAMRQAEEENRKRTQEEENRVLEKPGSFSLEVESEGKTEAQGLYPQEGEHFEEDARRKTEVTKQSRIARQVAAAVAVVLVIFGFVFWLTKSPEEIHQTTGAAQPAVKMTNLRLPDGASIYVPEGSFNYSLAQWLAGTTDTTVPKRFVFDNLNFETGSAQLTPGSVPTVDSLVVILKAYPAVAVRLEGHTDNTGDAAANKKLSLDRRSSSRKSWSRVESPKDASAPMATVKRSRLLPTTPRKGGPKTGELSWSWRKGKTCSHQAQPRSSAAHDAEM